VEVVADGTSLAVWIDDQPALFATDESFSSGTMALYSWANRGSVFDDVLVENLSTGAVLLQEDFDDGDYTAWTVVDEGAVQGPSEWSAQSGTLVQSANIYSGPTDRSSLAKLGTFVVFDD